MWNCFLVGIRRLLTITYFKSSCSHHANRNDDRNVAKIHDARWWAVSDCTGEIADLQHFITECNICSNKLFFSWAWNGLLNIQPGILHTFWLAVRFVPLLLLTFADKHDNFGAVVAPADRFLRIALNKSWLTLTMTTWQLTPTNYRNDKCLCGNQTEVQRGDQSDGRGCGGHCGVVGHQAEEEEGEEEAAGCEDFKGPFSVYHPVYHLSLSCTGWPICSRTWVRLT